MNFEKNLNCLVFLCLPVHAILYTLAIYLVPFREVLSLLLANVFA